MVSLIKNALYGIAMKFLAMLGQAGWDGFWHVLFWAVGQAEELWQESGQGEAKKKWVVDTVVGFLQEKFEFGWILKTSLNLLVSQVVNTLIGQINEQLGKDWVEHAYELEQKVVERFGILMSATRNY